jgi:hypothetical protein
MFQSVEADEIFDLHKARASEEHPSYLLAQLRKADWYALLKFLNVKTRNSLPKQALAEIALQRLEFIVCESRGDVWQIWAETRQLYRGFVIQFRHSESNWSCGIPEFVNLEKNDLLGVVNIAGRLFCKIK